MKKLLTICALLFCTILTVTNCNKEDEAASLNGTTWQYRDTYTRLAIRFTESSFTATSLDSDGDQYTSMGTYIYNPPTVTINGSDGFVGTGTINGNSFSYRGFILTKM